MRKSILVTGFVLASALTGCKDNTPTCVPTTVQSGCICNTGNFGYQVCSSDGLSYGACLCGSPPDAAVMSGDGSAPSEDAMMQDGPRNGT